MRSIRPTGLAIACLAGLAVAGGALAQTETDQPAAVAVLYDQPNFHGHGVRIVGGAVDLQRLGFSHRAMSGHFEGDWMVCDGPRYTGRCITVTGTLPYFTTLGLDRQIASLRQGETLSEGLRGPGETAAPPPPADDGYFDTGHAHAQLPPPEPPSQPLPDAAPPSPTPWRAADSADPGVAGYGSVFFIRPRRDGEDIPGQGRALADGFCRAQGLGPALYFDTDGRILRDVLCRRD